MKKVFFSILSCFIVLYTTAQTPQAIKYQAVARDNSGNIIANQNIGFRIFIPTFLIRLPQLDKFL
jgi:hypothetical protein